MSKTLLDVGNCGPDFNSIRRMVHQNFEASTLQAHGAEDALELLRDKKVDLVTVNRKLDRDYTDGIDVIKAIKAEADLTGIPVMLVTNYDEHQEAAMAEGAVRGFGKLAIDEDATRDLLSPYLA